ncbi:oxidoreductase [Nocardioides sp. SR21]|uniref:WD40/YVTN/BNR-like repeat-containing protein n=1 Tax=Nocardioides sp. SR21 TaxID=2919501 RepID=UPI001FAA6E90|nr:oxidoreductase [Nocardioides sp. SR21]
MARLGALILSTLLLGSVLGSPAYAGGGGPGHHHGHVISWQESVIDPGQNFRGLDAVDRRTAWVTGGSGSGKVFRTTDGGRSWADVTPPDATGLLFRDVEARSAKVAVVLTIGEGDASRIYRTADGGKSWDSVFVNDDPAAFYDCLAFYPDGRRGLALSDPVDGKFRILSTKDAGRTWAVLPSDGMPEAPTEAGFAASGDCLVTAGRTAYFGSGGGAARIFRSDDYGLTWTATDSTIPAGEAAGVFALAFRTPHQGIAVGGDFSAPADGADAVAVTRDGTTWRNAGDLTHLAEDVAYLPSRGHSLVVTGEGVTEDGGTVMGTSVSTDGGRTWKRVSDTGFHTLDCTRDGSCWAAGGNGRVARVSR